MEEVSRPEPRERRAATSTDSVVSSLPRSTTDAMLPTIGEWPPLRHASERRRWTRSLLFATGITAQAWRCVCPRFLFGALLAGSYVLHRDCSATFMSICSMQWGQLQLFLKKVAGRHGRPDYEPSDEDGMWVISKATGCVHADIVCSEC